MEDPTSRRKTLCVLLYVKGTSDKLGDICRRAGVHLVFQQKTTLRSMLTRVKGPQKHVDKGVVYQIPRAQCNEVYIRETGRPLKTKISEHKRPVTMGDSRNANAVHWMRTGHSMDWKAATVEGQCTHQDQEDLQPGLGIPLESSVELADYASRGVNNFQLSDWSAWFTSTQYGPIIAHSLLVHSIDQSLPFAQVYKLPPFLLLYCMPDEARDE